MSEERDAKQFNWSEAEKIVEIATTAGGLLSAREIEVEDSRELVTFIIRAGQQFESDFRRDLAFGNADECDYMERIETFALEVLRKRYPASGKPATDAIVGHTQTWDAFVVVDGDRQTFFTDPAAEFGEVDPDAQERAANFLIEEGGELFKVKIEGRIIAATKLDAAPVNVVRSFRFVRCVGGGFEIAKRSEADVIGEYEDRGDGLPMHVRDWPLEFAFRFPTIEALPEVDDESEVAR